MRDFPTACRDVKELRVSDGSRYSRLESTEEFVSLHMALASMAVVFRSLQVEASANNHLLPFIVIMSTIRLETSW